MYLRSSNSLQVGDLALVEVGHKFILIVDGGSRVRESHGANLGLQERLIGSQLLCCLFLF